MKICPKCNSANNDNAIICKACGYSLSKASKDYRDYVGELYEAKAKKERRLRLIHNILVSIIGFMYYLLLILCISKDIKSGNIDILIIIFVGIIIPIIVYVSIHHPEFGFYLSHMSSIDNLDEVQISDLYLLGSKIEGCTTLLVTLIFLFVYVLSK